MRAIRSITMKSSIGASVQRRAHVGPPATHFFAFAETGGMRDATPLKSYCNGQRYDIVMGFVGRG